MIADELKEQFGEDFLSDDELNELLGDDFTDEVLEDPNWDMDLKLRSGLGYGDNVLFGAFRSRLLPVISSVVWMGLYIVSPMMARPMPIFTFTPST